MKNLILILILAFSINAFSQSPQDVTLAKNVAMSSNRSLIQYIPENYTWGLTVSYTDLTGTKNGVIKLQVSDDGTNYANYAGMDTLNITANGFAIFEDDYFAHKFLKILYVKNSITNGKLNALLILKPRN